MRIDALDGSACAKCKNRSSNDHLSLKSLNVSHDGKTIKGQQHKIQVLDVQK